MATIKRTTNQGGSIGKIGKTMIIDQRFKLPKLPGLPPSKPK